MPPVPFRIGWWLSCLAGATAIEEANVVLEAFLPRFNERFGVPAGGPETAYRPVNLGLEI